MLMLDVRRKIKEVNALFPDVSARQIWDKLQTISSQVRRRQIGEGKGKGKGKQSRTQKCSVAGCHPKTTGIANHIRRYRRNLSPAERQRLAFICRW